MHVTLIKNQQTTIIIVNEKNPLLARPNILLSEQIRAESFKLHQYSEQSFFLGIRLGTEARALL